MNRLPIRYARSSDPATLRLDIVPDGQRLVRSGTDIDGAHAGSGSGIGVRRVRVAGAGSTTDETATGVTTGIGWDLAIGDHYIFVLWEGFSSAGAGGFQFIPVGSGGLVTSVFSALGEAGRSNIADVCRATALSGVLNFINAGTTRTGVTLRMHARVTTAGTLTLNYRREPGSGATITQSRASGFAVRGV